MATKTTTTTKQAPKTAKVTFKVDTKASETVYLVGSVKALGEWNLEKAIKLELCEECGKYTVSKTLPLGEVVEYKLLSAKDWANVEKGMFNEDIKNHTVTVAKGAIAEVIVYNFAK